MQMEDVIKRFRESNLPGTNRYRFRTFDNSFTGRSTVDWLVENAVEAPKLLRAEAVNVGQELMRLGVIQHVLKEQIFEDKPFLYNFIGVPNYTIFL